MTNRTSPLPSVERIEEGKRYHYLFPEEGQKWFTVEEIWEGTWGPKWETIYTLRFEDGAKKLTPSDTLSEHISNDMVHGY